MMRVSRVAVVVLSLGSLAHAFGPEMPAPQAQQVFVSVTDGKGAPVVGLGAGDFIVRVGDKDATIITASRAFEPLSIVVVTQGFSNASISDARAALRAVISSARAQHPDSRVGLMVGDGAAAPVMHPVSDKADRLEAEVSRFFESSRNTPMLDAILVASKTLAAEVGKRRAILVLNGGGDSNTIAPLRVARAVQDAGAALWAVEIGGDRGLGTSEGRVMSEVTKSSGGRREFSSLQGLAPALERIVGIIGKQYAVTYEPPTSGDVSSIAVRRSGLNVYGPVWAGLKLSNR